MTAGDGLLLTQPVAYRGRVYLLDHQLDEDGANRAAQEIVNATEAFSSRIRSVLGQRGAKITGASGKTKLTPASDGPEGSRGPRIRFPDVHFLTEASGELSLRVHVNVCRGTTHSKILGRIHPRSVREYTPEQAADHFKFCTAWAKPVYEAVSEIYDSVLRRCANTKSMEPAVVLSLSGIQSPDPSLRDLLRDLQYGVFGLQVAYAIEEYRNCVHVLSSLSGIEVSELFRRAPVDTKEFCSAIRKWHVRRGPASGLYVGYITNEYVDLVGLCARTDPRTREALEPSLSATMALVGEITAKL